VLIGSGVSLPLALSLTTRAEVGRTDTWTRRPRDGVQALIVTEQDVYPDLTLRWTWRPVQPMGPFAGVGATAGWAVNVQRTDAPNELGAFADQGRGRTERVPVSATITWNLFGPLTTSVAWSHTSRDDERPGALTESRADDLSLGIGRTFPLPSQWQQRSGLRTQLSWQRQGARAVVTDAVRELGAAPAAAFRSVVADNGREAINLNADTDLSETMSFSIAASRVVTFDRTFNRRFSQSTVSAVLQLYFFGGAGR
jgi:hypothetical protein